jgi:hypothetical protein
MTATIEANLSPTIAQLPIEVPQPIMIKRGSKGILNNRVRYLSEDLIITYLMKTSRSILNNLEVLRMPRL